MPETLGKILFPCGALLLVSGAVLWALGRALVGRLPGDIVISRPGFTFVLPVATSILLSLILTGLFFLVRFLRRP